MRTDDIGQKRWLDFRCQRWISLPPTLSRFDPLEITAASTNDNGVRIGLLEPEAYCKSFPSIPFNDHVPSEPTPQVNISPPHVGARTSEFTHALTHPQPPALSFEQTKHFTPLPFHLDLVSINNSFRSASFRQHHGDQYGKQASMAACRYVTASWCLTE